MHKLYTPLFIALLFAACTQPQKSENKTLTNTQDSLTELSKVYTTPEKSKLYSANVKDSFAIFKTVPSSYNKDSAKKYPLVILLDANAFFEPFTANAKFSTFIGDMDECVIAGVGYKDFPTLDSVRSRDYTYPVAIPEYEMALSGGAVNFKNFLDKELIPQLEKEYKIDTQKIILCGHSLGGYFTLFYMLRSAQENSFVIKNFVSASPSLFYNNRYLFKMADSTATLQKALPAKLYISMGSGDMEDSTSKNILWAFIGQLNKQHFKGFTMQAAEYSNFEHIDAALPGFSKGLKFMFEKK